MQSVICVPTEFTFRLIFSAGRPKGTACRAHAIKPLLSGFGSLSTSANSVNHKRGYHKNKRQTLSIAQQKEERQNADHFMELESLKPLRVRGGLKASKQSYSR